MRLFLPLLLCVLWSTSADAGDTPTDDIRPIQTDSTDVFEVLTNLRLAQSALTRREYGAARQGFESVLMHDPHLASAKSGLRQTLIATGNFGHAQHLIEDKNSPDGVIIRVRLGQIAEPETLIAATLKIKSDPRLWTLLGQLQDEGGEYLSARQSYAMAGLAGARRGLAENNIGHSHWLAGEYELALEAFTKASKLDPSDRQFDNNRRRALVQLGQTQEAIAGLDASRAGSFLAQAGDKAALDNEIKLAKILYRKSLNIAPRHNPLTAEKLARLEQ